MKKQLDDHAPLIGTITETEVSFLIDCACEVRRQAYAPYSHYAVGAAILGEDGTIYKACNVENASYGATICAERAAAALAVSAGCRSFLAIAIVGAPREQALDEVRAPAYPCGICRQVLREFAAGSFQLIVARSKQCYEIYTLEDLLPHSFGSDQMH